MLAPNLPETYSLLMSSVAAAGPKQAVFNWTASWGEKILNMALRPLIEFANGRT
jgi:hypothetical protein